MLTIKSDDVYGRSKAYESIIKGTQIVGPKVPESFNVLVKELQGLSLKVDLISSSEIIDAEAVLASNIKEEAQNLTTIDVPQPLVSEVDESKDSSLNEFMVVGLDDTMPEDVAEVTEADIIEEVEAALTTVDEETKEDA
jgi:DNA-directed RNA polymerase subunit beta